MILLKEDDWFKDFRIGINEISNTYEFKSQLFKRFSELKEHNPQVEFWIKKIIWKKPEFSKGYVQYSIRPYVLGYGCNGTTDDNIHLLAWIYFFRRDINYIELYQRAYEERGNADWIKVLLRDELLRKETVIPKNINFKLLINDLNDINNHGLANYLEEHFG